MCYAHYDLQAFMALSNLAEDPSELEVLSPDVSLPTLIPSFTGEPSCAYDRGASSAMCSQREKGGGKPTSC